jgi:GNAT superfamily N-acetyltransferase
MASTEHSSTVTIRRARPEDAVECGRICYEAFRTINAAHNFPPELPQMERGINIMTMMFSNPGCYCVVAEADGRLIGSNCLDERSTIFGIGPITVDPDAQNAGIGRALMEAVLERTAQRAAAGVRLVQAAFHTRSLSLYTKLGFEVREPLAVMSGPPIKKAIDGCHVRAAAADEAEDCNRLCALVHGHTRAGEFSAALQRGHVTVVERDGRIAAYTTGLGYFGHSVAESNRELEALIGAATEFVGPGVMIPTRNAALFRWCLDHGLRVVQPNTLMTMGLYNEPAGAWLPSIMY